MQYPMLTCFSVENYKSFQNFFPEIDNHILANFIIYWLVYGFSNRDGLQ